MNEDEFIAVLQKRAKEQKSTVEEVPFPRFFSLVLEWLSVHPMRLILPLSIILSVVLRVIFGPNYTNFILELFRWAL